MHFNELGLDEALLQAIESTGYTVPTQVQISAIPAVLKGGDLLVSSFTGSGKTAAFTLPCLHRLIERRPEHGSGPRMLVLAPTRELAQQVEKAVRTYGRKLPWLKTACLVGGEPFFAQAKQLSRPVDVVVATPGRLIDHLQRRKLRLSSIEMLVLDEADRMLDMGFAEDIDTIVAATPANRQTLLFSATLDGVVGRLAARLTRDPQRVEVAAAEGRKANIEQRLMMTDDLGHKNRLLQSLLNGEGLGQAVVFTATKRSAEEVSMTLQEQGFSAAALHGDMTQVARNRTLDKLRNGRIGVLVATDVAARGIDVAGISHVINFDPPRQAEDYVHRIGRTGRAGREGIAITFSGPREMGLIRSIERFTGASLAVHVIPGLEPSTRAHASRSGPRRGSGTGFGDRTGAPRGRPPVSKGWSNGSSEGWRAGSATATPSARPHADDGKAASRGERHGFERRDDKPGRGYDERRNSAAPRRPRADFR